MKHVQRHDEIAIAKEAPLTIQCKAKLFTIHSRLILRLPKSVSAELPSRGQVLVQGTINGVAFKTPLEPDGMGSHWLEVDAKMRQAVGAAAGDTVEVSLEPATDWPEPTLPDDLRAVLDASKELQALWARVTPLARWEWLRWINATSQAETRAKRIEVAASKLRSGMRRPCCFNRSMCCVPEVSKSGVLMVPPELTD